MMIFALVGGAGFLVDTIIVLTLVHVAAWQPIAARFVSFPVALTVTWLLNSRCTWKDRELKRHGKALALYVAGQGFASIVNLATFAIVVSASAWIRQMPVVGLIIAAIAGMLINYSWSNLLVFRGVSHD